MLDISGPLYLAKRMIAYCDWLKCDPPCKLTGCVMGGHSRNLLLDFGADQFDLHHFFVAMKDLLRRIEIADRKVPFCYFAVRGVLTWIKWSF